MKITTHKLMFIGWLCCFFGHAMAQLSPGSWQAKWIGIGYAELPGSGIPQYFRKEFTAGKKIKKAMAFITSRGLYEARLNGKRIGDQYLAPGWTSYHTRLQFQSYDVTTLLITGGNTIDAMLGNGWYRGEIPFDAKYHYGEKLGLLFQLELTYADGSKEMVLSDQSWKSAKGQSTYAEIYHGETIDHRIKDVDWSGVEELGYDYKNLVVQETEPIRKQEQLAPLRIFTTPKGEQVIDFGQELTGWVVVKATGPAGSHIVIDHGEVLDKAGNFYRENIRGAKAQANYILSGGGLEVFEPHFTYYGFRYIKVSGYPGKLLPENFTAVVLHSDMTPTGTFSCSDSLINKLQHNIVWGQKGNFLDVPTDCPQRDERLGWTGDAQAFFRTATFNYNVKDFFGKWMRDVRADQRSDGKVPFVIPDVLDINKTGAGGSSGWSDVATIIPWQLYEVYGDQALLAEQYPTMKGWVDYMVSKMDKKDLFNVGFHFGDWLSYRPSDDNGTEAVTDKAQISQCFFAHSTQNLLNAAKVLGKSEDVAKYTALLERIKAAFLKEYMTGNGRLMSNTQTAYVLALHFDMLPEDKRAQALAYLVDNIRRYDNHLTTGFLGTPYLCHVLSRFGRADVAYTLLTQKTYPSWLYPVTMGATTIWERWNGIKPDGEFYHPLMNSFNHYAYGAIGDWMYQNVLGIQAASPGYKKIIIKPLIGGGLSWAKGSYRSASGLISSSWKLTGSLVELEVEIPIGTTAEVWLPGAAKFEAVGPGQHKFSGSYFGQLQKISLYEENKIPFAKSVTELPTLTVYRPVKENKKGIAVIVCSGGAYGGRATGVEGIPACEKLAREGITAFLLDYRVPNAERMEHKELVPLTDAQRAIQYVREHAGDFNIDPAKLGMMGFSAGGHLVSTAGTHFRNTVLENPNKTSLRLDFMVLVYPVISFSDSLTHEGSRNNLIGPDFSAEQVSNYSNELQVSGETPPAFLVHGRNDSGVKFANSEVFYSALKKMGVKAEFLRYEKGEHGFGAYNKDSEINWMDECIKWIRKNW